MAGHRFFPDDTLDESSVCLEDLEGKSQGLAFCRTAAIAMSLFFIAITLACSRARPSIITACKAASISLEGKQMPPMRGERRARRRICIQPDGFVYGHEEVETTAREPLSLLTYTEQVPLAF